MHQALLQQLRSVPMYRRLDPPDLEALASVARSSLYSRGDVIFREGSDADCFHTIVRGRVKVAKAAGAGSEMILAILGPGDPVGAVAVFLGVPFPATAEALEDTICVHVARDALYELLSRRSLVQGLLLGMTTRLMELTGRLAAMSGTRVEPRLARLFLKLAEQMGKVESEGTWIPLHLSRRDLADLTGTTIETCIRVMSRWDREGIVLTRDQGFLIPDEATLLQIAGTADICIAE